MIRRRVVRTWLLAWLGGSVLGIANGVFRETVVTRATSDGPANQISVATLIALLALYFRALERRWPLETRGEAFAVGAAWVALTVVFEFGFGHYVDGKSWAELTANYDLASGHLWVLVLLWIAVGPTATRATAARGRARSARVLRDFRGGASA